MLTYNEEATRTTESAQDERLTPAYPVQPDPGNEAKDPVCYCESCRQLQCCFVTETEVDGEDVWEVIDLLHQVDVQVNGFGHLRVN